jgi:hypothetical protein
MSWILRLIVFGCIVVALPLVIMTTIRIYVESFTNQQSYYIGIGLSVAGLIAFILMTIKTSSRKAERTSRIRIDELRKQNQSLHYEKEVALTSQDIASLNVYRVGAFIVVVIAGLVVGLLVSQFKEIVAEWKPIVTGLTLIAFIALGWWLNSKASKMIAQGKKSVVRGIITEKKTTEDHREKTTHWLYIGDQQIKVNMFTYGKYRVGNAAEFHLFEGFGNLILHHEKLEGSGLGEE